MIIHNTTMCYKTFISVSVVKKFMMYKYEYSRVCMKNTYFQCIFYVEDVKVNAIMLYNMLFNFRLNTDIGTEL